MSARHRCSDDIHHTENVSVGYKSAGAFVFSVAGVVPGSTYRAGLACIPRIDIENAYSCQGCLVLDELCQAIETPAMEVLCVFAACSCHLADAREFFKLDGGDVVRFREVDNLTGDFVVLVGHPALLFVV